MSQQIETQPTVPSLQQYFIEKHNIQVPTDLFADSLDRYGNRFVLLLLDRACGLAHQRSASALEPQDVEGALHCILSRDVVNSMMQIGKDLLESYANQKEKDRLFGDDDGFDALPMV